jgi:hypothetical protein
MQQEGMVLGVVVLVVVVVVVVVVAVEEKNVEALLTRTQAEEERTLR